MPYNRPIKTIASVGGLYSNRSTLQEVISSDTTPTEKPNGEALVEGDYWYDITNSNLYLFIVDQFVLVGGPGTISNQQNQINALSTQINDNTEVDLSQGIMINNNTSSISDLGQQINDIKGRLDVLEAPENIE